ncbi:hypothetical protein [Streptomyces sp. NPDC019890]|uniref:hypothetical protein n=1 Tax=Streptomyces sp. NPDC019890 TaxID=3365064 RepID=UPI003850DA81
MPDRASPVAIRHLASRPIEMPKAGSEAVLRALHRPALQADVRREPEQQICPTWDQSVAAAGIFLGLFGDEALVQVPDALLGFRTQRTGRHGRCDAQGLGRDIGCRQGPR